MALKEWFGAKYDQKEEKIYLEFPVNGKKRFLALMFEIDPEGERVMPDTLKPDFASFSLYPDAPGLKGPDFSKLEAPPFVWAFYSFKGGVSRTLHLVSLVKAMSEQVPPKKALIVDADLEAPGLTWWAQEQLGKAEISFLDFLALAHYDDSRDFSNSLSMTAEYLRRQILTFETRETKVEHFILPAFREVQQLMRMPIRPENVCWQSGKEWIIPELLWQLGKALDVHLVAVDLRAGLSEISSPILFDPRVGRFLVTTPSGQSVEGTGRVLEQIKKISRMLKKDMPDDERYVPTAVLTMIKQDLKDLPDLEKIKEELIEQILPVETEDRELFEKEVLLESFFDEDLLYLKDLKGTLKKLDNTAMHQLMTRIASDWLSPEVGEGAASVREGTEKYKADLEKLRDVAKDYEFAESGKATNFLTTQNLKNIARKFESSMPAAVIMGSKGSGKTYTYLQLAHLKQWSKFIEKVDVKGKMEADYGFIWPLLSSKNLEEDARKIVNDCRQFASDAKKHAISFKPLPTRELENLIDQQKKTGGTGLSSWREFWLQLMARSISCENEPDPLEAMQKLLGGNDTRIIFQIDGLEDHFQNIGKDAVEQTAIRALCQSAVEAIQEWPDNRIGLIIFIRKDLVKSSIEQNFGQFESRYRTLELKWDREEALRLVAWLVKEAAGLADYVNYNGSIESVSSEFIEKKLKDLWGLKLGKPNSREAYTANWVIAALSDFNAQLQARDLVRLIRHAAENAIKMDRYPDRLLPPSAIKNALDPCSSKKIEEIQQEIMALKEIFGKLENIPTEQKQIPFDRNMPGLSTDEINTMTRVGIVTEYEGKYYMPEIIRRGLKFSLVSRGRLKVLTLLKRALNT
jgi:cellulose biosynthesis protein BcsQ